MKAILKLENIGQKIGKETLNFNSGVVTLISGRNASGKSRIIKSCALALSLPITSDGLLEEAINFGILKGDNAEYLPLVNSNKEKAFIELQYGDVIKEVELNRNGNNKINPPGEEKFLYSSLIVRNSKISNFISRGDSNFKWIVNVMSLAKDYVTIHDVVKSYLELLDLKKKEIEDKEKKNKEIKKKLDNLNNLKKKIDYELKKIEEEIDKIESELDPELRGKRSKIKDNIEERVVDIKEYNKEIKESENKNSELENKLGNSAKRLEKIRKKLVELKKRKVELEKIKKEQLTEERYELEKSQPKEKIGALKAEEKKLKEILEELGDKNEMECYTCHEGTLYRVKMEEKLKKIQENRKTFDEAIKKKEERIKEITRLINERNELSEKLNEIREKNSEAADLKEKLDDYEDQKKNNKSKIEFLFKNVTQDNETLEKLNQELSDIEKEIKKEEQFKPLLNKKSEIKSELISIDKEILNLEEEKQKGKIVEILEYQLDIQKSTDLINELEEILNDVNIHLNSRIQEQREGAAKKFNENINRLIKELNFSEFKEISLDLEDYNLKVIRSDDTMQELSSLSEGERDVIAALLQICAKETYLPHIPFLIGDDIISDIDPNRQKLLLNYLKEVAKRNEWFIILTKITDEDLTISEI